MKHARIPLFAWKLIEKQKKGDLNEDMTTTFQCSASYTVLTRIGVTLLYARERIYILNAYIEITSGGEPNLQN